MSADTKVIGDHRLRHASARLAKDTSLRPPNLGPPCQCPAMNSPHEPASPASSSTDSLEDDVIPHEYSGSATHEKAERPSFITNTFAFAKSVAKRRLPGGTTKTTGNRDPKARRREDGGQRRGGPSDRRDPTKGKDDLLDVALFELLKKSEAILVDFPPIFLSNAFHRNRRPYQRRNDQARCLSAPFYDRKDALMRVFLRCGISTLYRDA